MIGNVKVMKWPQWFKQMWPGEAHRRRVLEGYRGIAERYPHTLADFALRNRVFDAADADTVYEAGVAEGRRRAALELFKLCNMDINELFRRTQENGAREP